MIVVSNVRLGLDDNIENIKNKLEKKLRLKNKDISYKILKESLDARKSKDMSFVYQVLVDIDEKSLKKSVLEDKDVSLYKNPNQKILKKGSIKLQNPILVVGSGPCGLFCAYKLCMYGYKVILIDRGKDVDNREKDVKKFWSTGILNEDSNVQFGEGGAGTFSDGKLTSRSKDTRSNEIFDILYKYGADKSVLYKQKPHIGTDILKNIVKNMRTSMQISGVDVRFNAKLENFVIKDDKVISAIISGEKVDVSLVVLAIGHSSIDTFYMLDKNGFALENKPFAVGFRIEHLREDIDKAQYKEHYKNKKLSSSEYFLTNSVSEYEKSVYTFCMCPGGFVIPASSSKQELVVNGMSYSSRDNINSNSAILVNVNEKDFGSSALFSSVRFQKNIEKKAYKLGKGDFKAPVQTVGDFLLGKKSEKLGVVKPTYSIGYELCNLEEIYDNKVTESIKKSIIQMDKKLKGFAFSSAVLTGVETRSSSPIRILRDRENLYSTKIKNVYPAGEGAGYAGGIVSSSIDGLKIAEKIIEKYC